MPRRVCEKLVKKLEYNNMVGEFVPNIDLIIV